VKVCRRAGVASLTLALLVMLELPVFAQVDLTGMWDRRRHEDDPARGPGPALGDYLGLPLNDEARVRADAWQSSLQAKPEHQCIMYTAWYMVMNFGVQIASDSDPISGETTAFRISGAIDRAPRIIWMDGRSHPSPSAPHTTAGFSTGRWHGDMLVVYTTHLTEGTIWRNGVPHSDQASITEFITRHGDVLTDTMFLDDPIYLEEPYVRNTSWVLDPTLRIAPEPCSPQIEVSRPLGEVPHFLPGANPFLNEPALKFKIPADAIRGGAATMYPEYRRKLGSTGTGSE
jgi:hypothetical protein